MLVEVHHHSKTLFLLLDLSLISRDESAKKVKTTKPDLLFSSFREENCIFSS